RPLGSVDPGTRGGGHNFRGHGIHGLLETPQGRRTRSTSGKRYGLKGGLPRWCVYPSYEASASRDQSLAPAALGGTLLLVWMNFLISCPREARLLRWSDTARGAPRAR